jgi:hypothetical protein
MTSELKSATARANGAKSRGPKSPETREKSSRNSIQHGFTARKTVVLECENNDEFHEILDDYVATYQPGSPVESNVVDEMVAARWRILRMRLIETALFDSEMNREHLPTDPQPEPTDPGYQLAAAFRRLADDSRALSLASRYESRLHRIHERYHRTLRELQQSRKEQTGEPVVPAPGQPEPPPVKPDEPVPVPSLDVEPARPSPPPELDQTQLDQSPIGQSPLSQSPLNQSELDQSQPNQTQLNQTQLSQTQLSQTQPNQTEPNLLGSSWGGAMRCPPAPVAEHLARRARKSRNEPKPTSSTAARRHVQRRVAMGHRGIRRYIGSNSFRCLRHLETV